MVTPANTVFPKRICRKLKNCHLKSSEDPFGRNSVTWSDDIMKQYY